MEGRRFLLGLTSKKIQNTVKETLFPIFCIGCDKEGEWVCSKCRFNFDTNGIFLCPVCKINSVFGKKCLNCYKKSELNSIIGVFSFKKNPDVNKLVEIWKYQYAEELSSIIGEFVQEFVQSNYFLLNNFEAIVPVPLHPRRLAERGFNQSEIIANYLSLIIKKPVLNLIKRNKYTKQQAKLKKDERLKNVNNAFSNIKNLSYKKIILVDDVYTTGSTMQECAKVLHLSGVGEVVGFVMVRA